MPSVTPQNTTPLEANRAKQILIVEDSPTQALRLRRVLEQQGYAVLVARHGREALELLKENQPALIISDINMPEMDGYLMCRAIKGDVSLQHIPVLLLTTLADAEDLVRGLEAQADYYLTKPYEEQVLLSRMTFLLQNPQSLDTNNANDAIEIILDGKTHIVSSHRRHMMNLLLSTYENAVQQNRELTKTQLELEKANQQLQAQARKLQKTEANYRELLENNADAMIVVDRAGNVRFLNPAARALFEREDHQFLSDMLKHAEAVGETIELTINRRSGEPCIAELRIVETHWEDEPASLATLRDVTSRKQSEAQLKHYEEQIAELQSKLGNQ